MANIFVVFAEIKKVKRSYILIDPGTLNQMERSASFCINEIREDDINILMNTVTELMIDKMKVINENSKICPNFVVFVPLNAKHFETLKKDPDKYDKFRSNLEDEIFDNRIENPNVKFHKEDDFARVLAEGVYALPIFKHENITYPYPQDQIQNAEKIPGLIDAIFSSA